jgi:hypothetical protein
MPHLNTQELNAIAVEVAKEYKTADGKPDPEFRDLAPTLRLPYWDWAYWDPEDGDTPVIPDIIVKEKWQVGREDKGQDHPSGVLGVRSSVSQPLLPCNHNCAADCSASLSRNGSELMPVVDLTIPGTVTAALPFREPPTTGITNGPFAAWCARCCAGHRSWTHAPRQRARR